MVYLWVGGVWPGGIQVHRFPGEGSGILQCLVVLGGNLEYMWGDL